MKRLLFLCVMFISSLSMGSEERKPITERDLIANSIEYTVRNPIKVTVVSYLIINQIFNGKNSLMCQGYKWATATLPKVIMEDGNKVIEQVKATSKEVFEFLRSSFIKENPQA